MMLWWWCCWQKRLAHILYWGQQGIQRDTDKAMQYYKSAAEDEKRDSTDLFDYGLLLATKSKTKNQKQESDKKQQEEDEKLASKGMQMLEQSAKMVSYKSYSN